MSEKCGDCPHFLKRRCQHPENKGKVVSGKRGLCYIMLGISKEEARKKENVARIKFLMGRVGLTIEDLR